jgi:hypothetical protein
VFKLQSNSPNQKKTIDGKQTTINQRRGMQSKPSTGSAARLESMQQQQSPSSELQL